MPRWVLVCPICTGDFNLWEISASSVSEFLFPSKPILPRDGLGTRCPTCGHDGVYIRADIIYRGL
jgi:hypothetical protein